MLKRTWQEPRPEAWWIRCWCGEHIIDPFLPDEDSWHSMHPVHPCLTMALWGHEWAAVAWMAAAEARYNPYGTKEERVRAVEVQCAAYRMHYGVE